MAPECDDPDMTGVVQYIPTLMAAASSSVKSNGTPDKVTVTATSGTDSVAIGYIGSNIASVTESSDNGGTSSNLITFTSQAMPGNALTIEPVTSTGYRNLVIVLANTSAPGSLVVAACGGGAIVTLPISVTVPV